MTRSWWVFLLYGLMAIVFGLFALFQPQATMRVVMLAVGLLALGDGLVSLLTVFRKGTALPAWLPGLPEATLAVTPAGLFELDSAATEADLDLRFAAPDLSRLVATLTGQSQPSVQIDGDAALAGDIQWLVDHVRWDIEALVQKLEHVFSALEGSSRTHADEMVARSIKEARSLSKDLVTKLEAVEQRLSMRARMSRAVV